MWTPRGVIRHSGERGQMDTDVFLHSVLVRAMESGLVIHLFG